MLLNTRNLLSEDIAFTYISFPNWKCFRVSFPAWFLFQLETQEIKRRNIESSQHSAETRGLTEKRQAMVAKLTHSFKSPNYSSTPLPLEHEDSSLPTELFQCKKSHRKKKQTDV